jgi:acyl dehydratase
MTSESKKVFDPERLLAWHVPDVRQRLHRRDLALYALSIGLGQDPLDTRQLRFLDPAADDLAALPSMPLVLAYPGFWLGDPAIGVDSAAVVHAEQSVELSRELPVEGELEGRTRVTHLVDQGVERGALLYSERQIRCGGQMIAVLRQTHMLRREGGFGSSMRKPIAPMPVSNGKPAHLVDQSTRPEQALLYRLNGDFNPIHIKPDIAERAGYPHPLLHGMCTFGIVTHALLRQICDYEHRSIKRISMRFTSPVFPGETIRTEIHNDRSFRARIVERNKIVVDYGHVELV